MTVILGDLTWWLSKVSWTQLICVTHEQNLTEHNYFCNLCTLGEIIQISDKQLKDKTHHDGTQTTASFHEGTTSEFHNFTRECLAHG